MGHVMSGGGAKVTAGTKGAPAARRLDWVRPAKDVLSVAGEFSGLYISILWHASL